MSKEVKVKVGRELTADEKKNLDRSKTAVLHPTPPKKDVEGQYPVNQAVQCPYCGSIGYAWIDTEFWTSLYCNNCGNYFYA